MFRARIQVRNVLNKSKAKCSGGRSRRGTTRVALGGVGKSPRFVTDMRRTGARGGMPTRSAAPRSRVSLATRGRRVSRVVSARRVDIWSGCERYLSGTSSRPTSLRRGVIFLNRRFRLSNCLLWYGEECLVPFRDGRAARLSVDSRFYYVSSRANERIAIREYEQPAALGVAWCDFAYLGAHFVFGLLDGVFNDAFASVNLSTLNGRCGQVKFSFLRTVWGHVSCVFGVMECLQCRGGVTSAYRTQVWDGPANFVSRRLSRRRPFIQAHHKVGPIGDVHDGARYQIRSRESVNAPSVIVSHFKREGGVSSRHDGLYDNFLYAVPPSARCAVGARFYGVALCWHEFVCVQSGTLLAGQFLPQDSRRNATRVRRSKREFFDGQFCFFHRRSLGAAIGPCGFRPMVVGDYFTCPAGYDICAKTVTT